MGYAFGIKLVRIGLNPPCPLLPSSSLSPVVMCETGATEKGSDTMKVFVGKFEVI